MTRDITVDGNVTNKATIADNDRFPMMDSEASPNAWKEVLFSLIKSTLKTYFDTLYSAIATVAYVLYAQGAQFSPADATTYYFGIGRGASPTTTAAQRKIFIPKAGVIKRVDISLHNNAGVAGSGETSTMSLRLNNTTDTTLSAAITATATSGNTSFFNITGLAIAVAAGDYFEIKWVTPTWATNPTNLNVDVQVYVE